MSQKLLLSSDDVKELKALYDKALTDKDEEAKVADRPRIIDAISAENVSCRAPHRPLFAIPWLADYLKAAGAYRGPAQCPVVAEHYPRLIEIESGPHLPLAEARVTGAAVAKVWRHLRH